MKLLYGFDKMVCDWVASQLKSSLTGGDFEPCVAIGIVDDQEELVAGCIFNNYRMGEVELTFAAKNPSWATRDILRQLFDYPFRQLCVQRITAFIAKPNKRARRVIEGWGFVQEGVKRKAIDGKDAIMYGCLPHEARFWSVTSNGKSAERIPA